MIIDIHEYEKDHSCDTCRYQNKQNHTCTHHMYRLLISEKCDYPNTDHSRLCKLWMQKEVNTSENL